MICERTVTSGALARTELKHDFNNFTLGSIKKLRKEKIPPFTHSLFPINKQNVNQKNKNHLLHASRETARSTVTK